MKLLFALLLLLILSMFAQAKDVSTIKDHRAEISSRTYTRGDGWTYLTIVPNETGDFVIAFGVNKYLSPTDFEEYDPHTVEIDVSYFCLGDFVDDEDKMIFSCQNKTVDFSRERDRVDKNGTAYWTEERVEDWSSVTKNLFLRKESLDGKSDWHEVTKVSLAKGVKKEYRLRMNAPYLRVGQTAASTYPDYDGKFDIAMYPSSETSAKSAASNGVLTLLDPAVNLTDGILGWWTFDNSSTSSTTMIDSAGLKNGTNNGFTQGYPGKVNESVNTTPGTANEVAMSDYPETSSITLMSWLNSSQWGLQTGRQWLSRDGAGRVFGTLQLNDANAPMLLYTFNNSNVYQECGMGLGAGYFKNNTLYHLAVTYNASFNSSHSMISWYVNGTYVKNCSSGTGRGSLKITTSDALQIGNRESSSDSWNGVIDEVGVYSRPLNADEILAIYNNNTAGRSYPFGADAPAAAAGPTTHLLLPASASWSWGASSSTVWNK